MSGYRRALRPPFYARRNERLFLRWAARASGATRLASRGEGTIIYPPVLIIGHHRIHVGRDVVIHPGAVLSVVEEHNGRRYDPVLVIGDGVRIGNDMVIACMGRVEIGDRVLTADRVFIGDTYHDYRDPTRAVLDQDMADPRPVRIGAGAFLGVNCSILPGVEVGEGAYVGAGAVVTRDVPAHAVVVGNPARVVRQFDGETWLDMAPAELGRAE